MTRIVQTPADRRRPFTTEEKKELAALAAMSDDQIDFSDIPELTDDFFRNAIRNPFNNPLYRARKTQLTVRLDADIVQWLRAQGKGYQTRLNSILRRAMVLDLRQTAMARLKARTSGTPKTHAIKTSTKASAIPSSRRKRRAA